MASSLPSEAPENAPRLGLIGELRDRNLDRRAFGLAAALVIETLIILLLFTLGSGIIGEPDAEETVTTFTAVEPSDPPDPATEEASPPSEPEPAPVSPDQPTLQTPPPPNQPSPLTVETPPVTLPIPMPAPPQPSQPAPSPVPRERAYGPPDTGSASSFDSQRVGRAPNGEPLFAARWYREPTDGELAGYLSTASGPSSALIACRTVPDFYVEDCELIGESPQGSQIGRAVLAAAWQFRVRPAIIGGRSQVGSWVRIRIDYISRR